ncbi:MAG: serine--tRNA ligase, partial [Methanothrix sp.]
MKFHLEASFRLSGDAGDARGEIEEFFNGAADLLKKGAADGKGAEVTAWSLGEAEISVVIESDRYVRAHDAILRLRRPLADLLGKRYRIGVRGIEVDKYEIEVESEISIDHKIPHVREMVHREGTLTLSLDVDEADLRNQVPDRIVSLLDEKIQAEGYGG